jgi:predicted alpha/beta-fold hydrolase
VQAAATLGEFDDAFIAPVYGFKDKEDYYTQSGYTVC